MDAPNTTRNAVLSSNGARPSRLGISRNWWILIGAGIGIALFISLFSPFASSDPDGLNKVAQEQGFDQQARDPGYDIIAGYSFPGVKNEHVAKILSGVTGVLLVAVLGLGFGFLIRRSRSMEATQPVSPSSETGGR